MTTESDLRRQNAALNEQVKLLVKTEHRLHRSQHEIDRQVTRIEWLTRFALGWTSASTTGGILADAARLVRKLFRVDTMAIVAAPGHALPDAAGAPARVVALASACGPLLALDAPIAAALGDLPACMAEALAHAGIADAAMPRDTIVVVIPLRAADGPPAAFLVSTTQAQGKATLLRESPGAKSLPFLQLLATHVEHMLRNTLLIDDLAHTQARLVAARDELEERVIARTRELRQEIVERKRAEHDLIVARDAAEAANRAKSAFLANMSHELRTPLNAIIGYAELLAEDAHADRDPTVRQDLDRINTAGRHLLRLVTDVLDLSKIEAGKMPVAQVPFDLAVAVAEVASTSRSLAERNGNALAVSRLDGLGTMTGDRTRLAQVLLNLLGNAAKFTRNGRITLDVTRDGAPGSVGDRIVFRVADTGIGMSPAVVRHLFLDFVQGDGSTTREYEGTGLGLAISRRLCRLMGGEIEVESTEGRGSVFTVTLPAAPRGDAAVSVTELGEKMMA